MDRKDPPLAQKDQSKPRRPSVVTQPTSNGNKPPNPNSAERLRPPTIEIAPPLTETQNQPQNDKTKPRRPSVVTQPTSNENKPPNPNSAERLRPPTTEIGPPRRPSQTVTPSLPSEAPRNNRLRSTVVPPKMSELGLPDAGSKRKTSVALTRKEVIQVLKEIKEADAAVEVPIIVISESDKKELHESLRESQQSKKPFKMSFLNKNKGGTIRSLDSGIASLMGDSNDGVVREWRPDWCVNKVGKGAGEIGNIRGIDFIDEGRVAVAERHRQSSRVQIFDCKRGESVTVLSEDSPVRQLRDPAGICRLTDRTFFAVADGKRIVYIDYTRNDFSEFKSLEKQIKLSGIVVDSKDQLIVTDIEKRNVAKYDVNGKRILKFKSDDFYQPNHVALSKEYSIVFVSDNRDGHGCVHMMSTDGTMLYKIGNYGSDEEKLVCPMGVCCLPNGKLVVADRAQNRLLTYDFRARTSEHLLMRDDGIYGPTCLATDGEKRLAFAEENQDFKKDEYKLKMFHRTQ